MRITIHSSLLAFAVFWLPAVAMGQDSTAQSSLPADQNSSSQGSGAQSGDLRRTPPAALSAMVGLEDDSANGGSGGDVPQIPSLLGGSGVSTAFASEMERSNYLRGGVNVSATYDDNPLLLSSGSTSNTSESVFGNIALAKSTPRMRWTLGYAGGLTVNQKITNENQGSHSLVFDSQFRLSPHVNLRVAENFGISTGYFDSGNSEPVIAGAGGPNASVITPLATQRSTMTTVETNYHFALNDLIGASGSFYYLDFVNVPAETSLTATQSESTSVFWLHRIFGPNWGGVTYRFQRLTYDPDGESLVHSFLFTDTMKLPGGFSANGFIGPQYSDDRGLLPGARQSSETTQWGISGGVSVGWHSGRTSLAGGYFRAITDGGGFSGAVRLDQVNGSFSRELTTSWSAVLSASYGKNNSLTVPFLNSASSIDVTSAGASLGRSIAKSLGFRLGYEHDFQQQLGVPGTSQTTPLQTFSAHRNRFYVTLSYQWAKPLGM